MDSSSGNVKKKRRGPYRKYLEEPPFTSSSSSATVTETEVFASVDIDQSVQEHVHACSTSKEVQLENENNSSSDTYNTEETNIWEPVHALEVDDTYQGVETDTTYCKNVNNDVGDQENLLQDLESKTSEEERYIPHVNDEFDRSYDKLWDEIYPVLKEQSEDLVDDRNEELTSVLNDIHSVTFSPTKCLSKENDNVNVEDPDIYLGCETKLGAAVLLLCCLVIRFRLPDEAMANILELISILLPSGHCMLSSMYRMQKYLRNYVALPNVQYFCSNCYTHVEKDTVLCPHCSCNLHVGGSVAYFIQLPLKNQLQSMFKRKRFTELTRTHRFKHYYKNEGNFISDIFDGSLYRSLFDDGFLKNPDNISFSMNTDGVPVFKSSKVSMWPVYLLINELPIAIRKKRENCLFYGMWVSAKKTQMWSFLKPLFEEIKEFETGVQLSDCEGKTFTCKATLLTCICDLPARCLVTNSIHFNGAFGCWFCLQRGETHRLDTGGTCHIYPYKNDDPKEPKRTKDIVFRSVETAVDKSTSHDKNYVTNGHKGPFWFMYLHYFDFIWGFSIDYMHGVCLGIMKMLLNLWFDPKHKQSGFSIVEKKAVVDNRLKSIRPTLAVTRLPRSLDELGHWKSSELRNFLLYWGLPVLNGLLPECCFTHYCLLVRAIFLLSKEKISDENIRVAEGCLFHFCRLFQDIYGIRYYTINLHQLVHLCDSVRATGPLFANNCFVYEDLNGFILQHIHGTQGVDTQIINTINLIQVVPALHDQYISEGSVEDEMYQNLMCGSERVNQNEIEENVFQVGPSRWRNLTDDEIELLFSSYSVMETRVKMFLQVNLKARGFYVYGSEYRRMTLRNQSVVAYQAPTDDCVRYCTIMCFLQLTNSANEVLNIALAQPL